MTNTVANLPLVLDVRRYFQDEARKLGKRERTRGAILDGIVQAIAERGLAGATVKEIAENSGVTHGTFYNHFESRDQAIQITGSAVATEILKAILNSIERSKRPDDAIVQGTYAFMSTALQRPSWGKVVAVTVDMHDESNDPATGALQSIVVEGHAAGVFRAPATPLMSLQIRIIQSLAILKGLSDGSADMILVETCEAILRLLGRTPKEAKTAVKRVVQQHS